VQLGAAKINERNHRLIWRPKVGGKRPTASQRGPPHACTVDFSSPLSSPVPHRMHACLLTLDLTPSPRVATVYPFAPANPNRVRSFSSLICFSSNGPSPIFPMNACMVMSTFLRTKLRVGAYMMHRHYTSAEAFASSCQAHVNVLVGGISIRLRAFWSIMAANVKIIWMDQGWKDPRVFTALFSSFFVRFYYLVFSLDFQAWTFRDESASSVRSCRASQVSRIFHSRTNGHKNIGLRRNVSPLSWIVQETNVSARQKNGSPEMHA